MAKARVLIVDDENNVREILKGMLSQEGYDVVAVENATAAIKEGGEKSFELLLTDIRMPDMSGLELVKRFQELNPQAAAILVTGYPNLETAKAGISQGVCDYIIKPIRQIELSKAVRRALKRREHIVTLEKAAQELEELEKTRHDFINTLSHELVTPLTPILGSAEMLSESIDQGETSLTDRLILSVLTGARTLRNRLDNLLTLAHLQIGNFTLKITPLDIITLLEDAISYFHPLAELKQQTLTIEVSPELPLIRCDGRCFTQIISSLLDNAIAMTPKGGIIKLRAWASIHELAVEVRDNAPHLSPEELERLSQSYWRSEVDRQRLPDFGLKLAICKYLVEAHGGKLEIESDSEGNLFALTVPIDKANLYQR